MKPTGPADWLMSFVETRRELYTNLDVWGVHIVRHAAAVSGDAWLVERALNGLVACGVLTRVRYVPHMPDPVLPPGNTSIWHNTEHTGPAWKWIYRVAPDWRERMGLASAASHDWLARFRATLKRVA